jgi:hypothetical protein
VIATLGLEMAEELSYRSAVRSWIASRVMGRWRWSAMKARNSRSVLSGDMRKWTRSDRRNWTL